MFKKIIWGAVFISFITVGCAGEQIYRSNPAMQTVSTQHYEVKLEPLRAEGYNYYNQFRCTFTNKTSGDLTIDWSETYYLQNGKRYGHFGWVGLTFEELRGIKEEPDITRCCGQNRNSRPFPAKIDRLEGRGRPAESRHPRGGLHQRDYSGRGKRYEHRGFKRRESVAQKSPGDHYPGVSS